MSNYDDILSDLYICPTCKEEYEHFRDAMNCYRNCLVGGNEDD